MFREMFTDYEDIRFVNINVLFYIYCDTYKIIKLIFLRIIENYYDYLYIYIYYYFAI